MSSARAGVPFIRCLEAPERVRGISALAVFPWKQLRRASAGCAGETGDALCPTAQPGDGLLCPATGAAGWLRLPERAPWPAQRREEILLLCRLAAEKWEQSCKTPSNPSICPACRGLEGNGTSMQQAFQNHVRALHVSPATSLAAELGSHLPPCLGGLGMPFPGRSPSAQPMVLTSPTELWEGASAWPPTISLLLGSSSTKGCKSPLKNTWCVCMCPPGTPRHPVTVVRSQVAALQSIWCQACACHTVMPKRCLVLAATLVSLLWESLAPTPGKSPCDQAGRQHFQA